MCTPNGRFTVASVCPAPKCRWLKSFGIGLVERRQLGIDQEMMMAGIGLLNACRRRAMLTRPKRRVAFCGTTDRSCKPTKYTRASAGAGFAQRRIDHADLEALAKRREGCAEYDPCLP